MSDQTNKEAAIKVFEREFEGFKFEMGAPMSCSIRGKQYEIVHQLLPRICLADGFNPMDVFVSMVRKYLAPWAGGHLVSIRTIESGVDVVTDDYYFYLRLCREESGAPAVFIALDTGGYKAI